MCWYNQIPAERKVAESDVRVVKFLTLNYAHKNVFYPPYKPFRYELGETYTENNFAEPTLKEAGHHQGKYVATIGFHSYSLNNKFELDGSVINIRANDELLLDCWLEAVYVGYMYEELPMCICLCAIPKGATYYINELGEYVSDKLRIDKVLDYLEDLAHENEDEFMDTFKHYYDL